MGLRPVVVADRSFDGGAHREVTAVLVGNATGAVAIRESESQPGWAQNQWTTPNGQTRTCRSDQGA